MSQRVLIFSDVHGNLPAFQQMLANEQHIDLYVSLGDVVNYGPWSNECVELLETLQPAVKLKGNHDGYFIEGKVPERTSEVCRLSFEQIYPTFKHQQILESYLDSYQLGDVLCTHTFHGQYVFPDSQIELDQNYFVGHSHHQFCLSANGFRLCNPGSVGQNRVTIDAINYAIFDPSTGECDFKSLPYDVEMVIEKMKAAKFPEACIRYYQNKPRIPSLASQNQ